MHKQKKGYPNQVGLEEGTRIPGGHKPHLFYLKNKRGQDKLISVYWFAILIIVAGAIVAMVSIFYNAPYDVRELEVSMLSEKVADCIYEGGQINPRLYSGGFRGEFKDNFLERCSLTFAKEKETDLNEFYTEAVFFSEGDVSKPMFNLSAGDKNWKVDCSGIAAENEYKKVVRCDNKVFYVGMEGKNYLVNVTSIVRKTEQNVK